MTSTAKQQLIYEVSYGNLKALQFSTADEVQAKVEEIRADFGYDKVELDIRHGLRSFDYSDYAQDRFHEIYDIEPWYLMEILGN